MIFSQCIKHSNILYSLRRIPSQFNHQNLQLLPDFGFDMPADAPMLFCVGDEGVFLTNNHKRHRPAVVWGSVSMSNKLWKLRGRKRTL